MRTAVITLVAGRHSHLALQRRGLLAGVLQPDLHIVVSMNDPGVRGVLDRRAPCPDVIEMPRWEPAASEPAVAKPAPPEAPVAEAPVKPPATAPAPMPSFTAPKAEPTAATIEIAQKLRSVRRHLAGWRVLAAVMALALVALAGLVAVWRYAPERVPPVLRPVALMRLAGISVDTGALPRRPLPPESQFEE